MAEGRRKAESRRSKGSRGTGGRLHSFCSSCSRTRSRSGCRGRRVGGVWGRGAEARRRRSQAKKRRTTSPDRPERSGSGKEWQNIPADQRARFRRIMRGAGDAHRADRRRRKAGRIRRPGGPTQDAPLAAQGAPGTPAQETVRVLFQIAAAAVPAPEPKERGGGGELNQRKPGLLLRRHQAGGGSTA